MVDGKTRLVGLIGWPVSHSFSPAMHNAALAECGLNYLYVPLPVSPGAVPKAVLGLAALGFRGVNITVPHKQAVMPLLDEVEEGARAIGAVNTIVIDGRQDSPQLTGYNTDWSGFLADLAGLKVKVADRDCLVLGAGGSARAVTYALAKSGGRVQLFARRPEQAETLVNDMTPFVAAETIVARSLVDLPTYSRAAAAPLIVNTTPVGMVPNQDRSIWPAAADWPAGTFLYDLVYNPRQTLLMQQAAAAGCQAVNGLGMLVHQGALAFEMWTGQPPNVQLMRETIQLP